MNSRLVVLTFANGLLVSRPLRLDPQQQRCRVAKVSAQFSWDYDGRMDTAPPVEYWEFEPTDQNVQLGSGEWAELWELVLPT